MKRSASLFVAALLVFASSCGYQFAASGSNLPKDAKTIYVKKFDNHTRYAGANDEFMRHLKNEIAMHQRLTLVDDPNRADLQLSGAITYFESTPTAFNSVLEPTIYHQNMTVRASLTDLRSKKTIWSTRGLSTVQNTSVVSQAVVPTSPTFLQQNLRAPDIGKLPDLQVAQTQTQAGRDNVMTQIAQSLYASMASGF
ncbi:MAG: LPS assembly lipoprotein LptE [Candidatus Binataceae bacterium]